MGRTKQTHCKRGHERIPENLYANGNCKICMVAHNSSPRHKQLKAEWTLNNRRALSEYSKNWNHTNYENYLAISRKATKIKVQKLTNAYIADRLRVPVKDIPPEIIQLTRALIQLKREIRNANRGKSIGANQ